MLAITTKNFPILARVIPYSRYILDQVTCGFHTIHTKHIIQGVLLAMIIV